MKKLYLIALILFLTACSAIREVSDIREPGVFYKDVHIQSLSFDDITLLFDFEVINPNRFDIEAQGLAYEFFINEHSFVDGIQDSPIQVERNSENIIQLPVSLNYREVYGIIGSAFRGDSLTYQLSSHVMFDLPVMGEKSVPVNASGEIPLPRLPRFEFGNMSIRELSLSGAKVDISFHVSNPNTFAISLNSANYTLNVNNHEWLDSSLDEEIRVASSERRTVEIPITLNSAQLGSAMMDIMSGNKEFNYTLSGTAKIAADVEGFEFFEQLPFSFEGVYQLN